MLSRQLIRSATRLSRSSSMPVRAVALAGARTRSLAPSTSTFRSFTVSSTRFEPSPLSTKLAEEIAYEDEHVDDPNAEPDFLTEFKKEGIWSITDEPGADEIVLSRTFDNESIRLIFSISDLDAEPSSELEADEQDYLEPGASSDAGSGGLGDESSEASSEENLPIQASITITKQGGSGALSIDAVAQDGLFSVNNVTFYQDAGVATSLTAEADWTRQGLYMGPAFDNLDEGVQNEFESFLEERGINSALALFIPDLAEYKEQKQVIGLGLTLSKHSS